LWLVINAAERGESALALKTGRPALLRRVPLYLVTIISQRHRSRENIEVTAELETLISGLRQKHWLLKLARGAPCVARVSVRPETRRCKRSLRKLHSRLHFTLLHVAAQGRTSTLFQFTWRVHLACQSSCALDLEANGREDRSTGHGGGSCVQAFVH